MNYWMNEPGFTFIFEFPMILAPSIVIPTFISLNLLHAGGIFVTEKKNRERLQLLEPSPAGCGIQPATTRDRREVL